jgi:hypothetical protein
VLGVVERGVEYKCCKDLPRAPQKLPSKRDKGAGVMFLQCRGKKKRWLVRAWFTWSVCKRVRENKREEKKRIRGLAKI